MGLKANGADTCSLSHMEFSSSNTNLTESKQVHLHGRISYVIFFKIKMAMVCCLSERCFCLIRALSLPIDIIHSLILLYTKNKDLFHILL